MAWAQCAGLSRVFFGIGLGGLDFVDDYGTVFFGEQAVDTAAYFEGDFVGFDQIRNVDFGLVIVGAGILDLLVSAGACDHAVGAGEAAGEQVS